MKQRVVNENDENNQVHGVRVM